MTKGSCACGEVAFEVDGELASPYYCHCSKCRRATGTAYTSSVFCRGADLRWVKGADFVSDYEGLRFCPRCGGLAPNALPAVTQLIWLPAGCLEDVDLRFEAHIFVGSKAPWDEITGDLPQYDDHLPEDEFCRLVFEKLGLHHVVAEMRRLAAAAKQEEIHKWNL